MIITIDGPSGTGKSTTARALADQIGYTYFDTGAMYRAFTYFALQRNADYENQETVTALVEEFDFSIRPRGMQKRYFVNEEDVTNQIREQYVTEKVSAIAALPEVRKRLVEIQKDYGHRINGVFEGRDLGTVVFPNADLKIFLTATPEVRAKRRFDELMIKFPELTETLTLEQLTRQIQERDDKDMTRSVSPLKQAEDAHLIDTSGMTIEEVVDAILACKEK
jgi:cytidylate kinase